MPGASLESSGREAASGAEGPGYVQTWASGGMRARGLAALHGPAGLCATPRAARLLLAGMSGLPPLPSCSGCLYRGRAGPLQSRCSLGEVCFHWKCCALGWGLDGTWLVPQASWRR